MKKNLLFKIGLPALLIITGAYLYFSLFNSYDEPIPGERRYNESPSNEEAAKKIKTSGALESLDLWARQRAYPDDIIPERGFYDAFEYSKRSFSPEQDNSGNNWEQIGPHNIGGRTLAVAFNPLNGNTVYAGSASGGLWRSYTGGVGVVAWQQIPTGFPVLGVGAIAIHPTDSNTIYIGTGEVYGYQNSFGGFTIRTTRGSYGIGILKTTDGGNTWTKSLDWSQNQQRGVQVMRINPLNPNTVWAGTTEGTYRSYDGGVNWTLVNNTIMVTDLIVNPADTSRILIACGNLGSTGNGFYLSTNSGSTWAQTTSGLPSSYGGKALFSVYTASPNVIFGSIGNGSSSGAGTWLVKTTNSGDTWSIINTFDYSTYQGWFSHFVGVNPADSSKIITAGVDVYKSTNGGLSLQRKTQWFLWDFGRVPIGGPEGPSNYSHADHHAIAYHPTNPNIAYFGNDGGIFRTTDGGETFEGVNGSYQTTQFYNGFSTSATDSLLSFGGMQDNASAIYDGQLAWIRVIGGDGSWTAINSRNDDTIYGSSQNLNILRSRNGGTNFFNIAPPSGGVTSFIAPYMLGQQNPQVMYAGRSIIYKSTNGGSSWNATNGGSALDGNPALGMSVSPLNDDVVYITTAPVINSVGVFRTTNGGTSWTNITGSLPNRYMIDIMADPQSESTVYVALSGFGSPHMYKSTNYGDTWTDITNGLPDLPTSSIAIDPQNNNYIYVGNDLGVYSSTDGGASWNAFATGMPDAAIVMDLAISKLNRKLRAVTHGNGVYERDLIASTVGIEPISQNIDYRLGQNYPNPFNPETSINFSIAKNGLVTIKIYNILGKEVSTLINENKPAGSYTVKWNGTDYSGNKVASGIYFYKLSATGGAGDYSDIKKMTLIR